MTVVRVGESRGINVSYTFDDAKRRRDSKSADDSSSVCKNQGASCG